MRPRIDGEFHPVGFEARHSEIEKITREMQARRAVAGDCAQRLVADEIGVLRGEAQNNISLVDRAQSLRYYQNGWRGLNRSQHAMTKHRLRQKPLAHWPRQRPILTIPARPGCREISQ